MRNASEDNELQRNASVETCTEYTRTFDLDKKMFTLLYFRVILSDERSCLVFGYVPLARWDEEGGEQGACTDRIVYYLPQMDIRNLGYTNVDRVSFSITASPLCNLFQQFQADWGKKEECSHRWSSILFAPDVHTKSRIYSRPWCTHEKRAYVVRMRPETFVYRSRRIWQYRRDKIIHPRAKGSTPPSLLPPTAETLFSTIAGQKYIARCIRVRRPDVFPRVANY